MVVILVAGLHVEYIVHAFVDTVFHLHVFAGFKHFVVVIVDFFELHR